MPSNNLRVGITGGTGFIGLALARSLASQGHEVFILDNGYNSNVHLPPERGITITQGDVRNLADFYRAFPRIDVLVNAAAESNVVRSESNADYAMVTSVGGLISAASYCQGLNIPLIHFSSREVYGQPSLSELPVAESAPFMPKNVYGRSKVEAEKVAGVFKESGVNITVLRLSNVIGLGDCPPRLIPNWIQSVSQKIPLTVYGGEQLLDFVTLETVVGVTTRLLSERTSFDPINVGGGRRYRLLDVAQAFKARWPDRVELDLRTARAVEVAGYQADISRLTSLLPGTFLPSDPLGYVLDQFQKIMVL